MRIEDLPYKVLISILEEVEERVENGEIDMETPFDRYNINELDNLMEYFGVKNMDVLDYSYILSLYKLNPNFRDVPLEKPQLKNYKVRHFENVREWKTYYFDNEVTSYLPITKREIYSLEESDLFVYYEGGVVDESVDESEITDSGIDFIKQIN
jgi:hypothetical protein